MSTGRLGAGDTAIQPTILDAKGDLIVATAADTPARLAVGSNNQTLLADSAQSTGVKWGSSPQSLMTATGDLLYASSANTPARLGIGSTNQVLTVSGGVPTWAAAGGGSYTELGSFSISGNQSFTSIPGTYRNLVVVMTALRPPNDNVYTMRINNDSNANRHKYGDYSTTQNISFDDTVWRLVNTQDSGVSQNITVVTIYEYANTACWKLGNILSISNNQTTTTNFNIQSGYGLYNQTDAITSLYFYNQVGGTSYGTVTLYGVK